MDWCHGEILLLKYITGGHFVQALVEVCAVRWDGGVTGKESDVTREKRHGGKKIDMAGENDVGEKRCSSGKTWWGKNEEREWLVEKGGDL